MRTVLTGASAVVRRAMRNGNSSLELGVQFIRGHVSPITLRTPNKGKEEQPGTTRTLQ